MRLLESAGGEAPGLTGAFKLLASIKSEKGEIKDAVGELKKVKLNAPGDYRTLFRLAIYQYKRGKVHEAIPLLKRIKGKNEKFARYLTGRIRFGKTLNDFKNLAHSGVKEKKSKSRKKIRTEIRNEFISLSRFFDGFSDYRDSAWYGWVCKVMSEVPETWIINRSTLLSQRPRGLDTPAPVEAQWIDALLRTTFLDFNSAMEGIEDLIRIADSQDDPEIHKTLYRDILIAFHIISDKTRTPAQFIRIFDNMNRKRFGEEKSYIELQRRLAVLMLKRNILDLSIIHEILLEHADLESVEFEFQLYRTVKSLLEGKFEKVPDRIDSTKIKSSGNKSEFQILDGICAIAKGNIESFDRIQSEVKTGKSQGRWEAVRTLAGIKFNQPHAIDSLCTIIDSSFRSKSKQKKNPILSMSPNIDSHKSASSTVGRSSSCSESLYPGILYYLTHNVLNKYKDKRNMVIDTICRIKPGDLKGDFETALALVHCLILLGEWKKVLPVFPVLDNASASINPEVKTEIGRIICHCFANSLEMNDFIFANEFLNMYDGGKQVEVNK